jgi:hypothetical protein
MRRAFYRDMTVLRAGRRLDTGGIATAAMPDSARATRSDLARRLSPPATSGRSFSLHAASANAVSHLYLFFHIFKDLYNRRLVAKRCRLGITSGLPRCESARRPVRPAPTARLTFDYARIRRTPIPRHRDACYVAIVGIYGADMATTVWLVDPRRAKGSGSASRCGDDFPFVPAGRRMRTAEILAAAPIVVGLFIAAVGLLVADSTQAWVGCAVAATVAFALGAAWARELRETPCMHDV